MKKSWLVTKFAARHEITRPQPSVAAATEGGEPVRHSAANGPERSEGAQSKLSEPGEEFQGGDFPISKRRSGSSQ